MLMTFFCFMLVKSARAIHRLAWVLVISLGVYGVKGGIFTLRSGGSYRVWGPDGTFIARTAHGAGFATACPPPSC
jgi:putative inorganic carbon (HCO3(-)) transporter